MSPTTPDSIETSKRKLRMAWYEEKMMKATNQVVSLLREMRDDPLKPWLASHGSLEQYLQDRWGISVRRQQQLFSAEDTRLLLSEEAPDLAETVKAMPERQMRELVQTPPDRRVEVLREAVSIQAAEGKRTRIRGVVPASTIKRAKAKVIDGVIVEPSAKKCPHCGGVL